MSALAIQYLPLTFPLQYLKVVETGSFFVLAFSLPSLQVISFFYTGIKQKQAEIVGQPEKGKK
jgi:hypothetical protein